MKTGNEALKFEHALRDELRDVSKHLEDSIGCNYVTITFVASDGGQWSVNTWGGGAKDVTTKGAVLSTVMTEHLRRCGVEQSLSVLPALLEAPKPAVIVDNSGIGNECTNYADKEDMPF
jgi:hypothetical protein